MEDWILPEQSLVGPAADSVRKAAMTGITSRLAVTDRVAVVPLWEPLHRACHQACVSQYLSVMERPF